MRRVVPEKKQNEKEKEKRKRKKKNSQKINEKNIN